MTLTTSVGPLTSRSVSPEVISPLWDINDTILPKNSECQPFDEWCDGHCRRIYDENDEDARKHTSGWAMRNTNNHNVSILKKSCLGVFMCNRRCTLDTGDIVRIRPAICDKARRKQLEKPCLSPKCSGRLELVPCRGHCGYPVTHFWRHHNGQIFFQSKGAHSHPQPEIKHSSETRRHAHSYNINGLYYGGQNARTPRKRPYTISDRPVLGSSKKTTAKEVICSCGPFEHTCTHPEFPSPPYPMYSYADTTPFQLPLCSLTLKMEYNKQAEHTSSHNSFGDRFPHPLRFPPNVENDNYRLSCYNTDRQVFPHHNVGFDNYPGHNVKPFIFEQNSAVMNRTSNNNNTDIVCTKPLKTQSEYSPPINAYEQFRILSQSQSRLSQSDYDSKPCILNANDTKTDSELQSVTNYGESNPLPSCDELARLIFANSDPAVGFERNYNNSTPTTSCQYTNAHQTRPPSCEYERSPVHFTELQTVTSKQYSYNPASAVTWASCDNNKSSSIPCTIPQYSRSNNPANFTYSERETANRCHTSGSPIFEHCEGRPSGESLTSYVNHNQQIHNHNINITLKYS